MKTPLLLQFLCTLMGVVFPQQFKGSKFCLTCSNKIDRIRSLQTAPKVGRISEMGLF